MFLLGNFVFAVAGLVKYALHLYMWIIIARTVLSWVSPDPYNPVVRFIYNITEPVMGRIRKSLPVSFGGIDLSPLIILMAIMFLQEFLTFCLFAPALPISVFAPIVLFPLRFGQP